MKTFSHAEFIASAGRLADFPPPGPRELAFAGRSNVGKSSAINALLGRKRLAYTSKTPGRTQTINFYELAGGARLVDFPGYGFAKVPRPLRVQFERLVGDYLWSGRALAGVVVVMDARHPLGPLDRQLLGWLGDTRVLLMLSKADKLNRAEQAAALRTVAASSAHETRLFSSVSGQGVEDCRRLLHHWVAADRENKKPPAKGN